LVVEFQINAISNRIPEMTVKVREELDQLAKEGKGKEDDEVANLKTTKFPVAVFDNTADFFTKLCSETTALAFDIHELANGSVTRPDRKFNLGPRFLVAIESRETQARRILPSFCSSESEGWLMKELGEFKGVVNNNDSMMHPIFRKAVREVCFPVLRLYAKSIKDDADHILREVTSLLIDERFANYPRLAESLKRDMGFIQVAKLKDVEALIQRLLEAELNWVFVSEKDLRNIQKEVEAGLNGHPISHEDDLPLMIHREEDMGAAGARVAPESGNGSRPSAGAAPGTTAGGGVAGNRLRPEEGTNRDLRVMQLSLDAYVRLLLRRVFYAVPMNVRNIIMNEFRRDLGALVAEKYNDEPRLRTLMSEELWINQKRQQHVERQKALEGVLRKLDQLS
jgi:hypothetical protein